jgi:TolB-like protein/Tfp pilus assembly protein PilF
MSFLEELKRRNVFRMAIAYAVMSWVILQILDVILNNYDAPSWLFHTVVLLLGIGFFLTLVFSWAFELTPDGIKRESEVDRSQSVTHQTGSRLTRAIVIMAALGLAYFTYQQFKADTFDSTATTEQAEHESSGTESNVGNAASKNSIAVLPFTNMSGDAANEPFTLGIHDDLLTHLSRIKALETTSRTSVLQYRDTTKSIPEIANELRVGNILEGSIQRSGNRVRINLQLIDAATDKHLWAEIYDRELTAENLFAVQGEIATEVANALSATLLPEEQTALAETPTQSMAAYDLYLLGRYHWQLATAESAELALDYFSKAIEEDPNYVLALSGLADAYVALVSYGNLTRNDAFPLAQEALDQAMAQDNSVSEVWASMGQLKLLSGDQPGALVALERAIELDEQNFWAWYRHGNNLRILRRFEDSLAAYQQAYALEPMSRPINETLGWAYFERGDFARSRPHFERVDQLQEGEKSQWKEAIARSYLDSGHLARTVVEARLVLAQDPSNTDAMTLLQSAYLMLGDMSEAETWVDQMESVATFNLSRVELFRVKGDFEDAVEFVDDMMVRFGNRAPQLVGFNFQNAYLAGMHESAESLLLEFLSHFGNRPPINPYDYRQWDYLIGLDFILNHMSGSLEIEEMAENGDSALNALDTVVLGLESLNTQGYRHPHTYLGLAMGYSLQGRIEEAMGALEESVARGYLDINRLNYEPTLKPLRADPRFSDIEMMIQEKLAQERIELAQATLAPFQPAQQQETIQLSREELEKYTGYFSDDNVVIHFYFDDQGQFTYIAGQSQGPFALVASASGEGEFFMPGQDSYKFNFETDENGKVTHFQLETRGVSNRFKAVAPPPPEIPLSQDILDRYLGTYQSEFIAGAEGGTSDVDIWTIRIFQDDKNKVWADFHNQPDLHIYPFSETEFLIPGFLGSWRFKVDPAAGKASGFDWHVGGTIRMFERVD